MLICLLTGTRTKRFNSTSTSCTWPNTRIFAFATKSIPLTLLGFNCTVNYYIPQLQNNKSKAHAQCKKVHFQVTATLQILWMEQEVDFILWLDFISEWGFVVDHCCPIFKRKLNRKRIEKRLQKCTYLEEKSRWKSGGGGGRHNGNAHHIIHPSTIEVHLSSTKRHIKLVTLIMMIRKGHPDK